MINLDMQIARINEALTQVGYRYGYRMCVNIALAIANRSIPKAPVDTGHLRNSCVVAANQGKGYEAKTTRTQMAHKNIRSYDRAQQETARAVLDTFLKSSTQPIAVVSFIAEYAPAVHEGNPSWNWNDGGPKFLEQGANEVIPLIPAMTKALIKGDRTRKKTTPEAKMAKKAGTGQDKPK